MSSQYSSGRRRSSKDFDSRNARRDAHSPSGGGGGSGSGSDSQLCEQAFLSAVGGDEAGKLRTFDEFAALVQQTGRNPSQRALRQYWDRHSAAGRRTGVDLQSFLDVCRQEPVTTREELLDAFHAVDLNSDGYLSVDEFVQMLSSGGEAVSKQEARELLLQYDRNGDGRLDYEEFIDFVLGDIQRSRRSFEERRKKSGGGGGGFGDDDDGSDEDYKGSSKNDLDRRNGRDDSPPLAAPRRRKGAADDSAGSSSNVDSRRGGGGGGGGSGSARLGSGRSVRATAPLKTPNDLRKWTHRRVTGFYLLDESSGPRRVASSYFTLNLKSASYVYITMQPMSQDKLQTMQSECDLGFALFRRGTPVAVSDAPVGKSGSGIGLKADLEAGEYQLLPYCCGDALTMTSSGGKAKPVTRNQRITAAGRAALEDIFKLCDTNQDGMLDKAEFQVYNYITSDEELTDELWDALGSMVKLKNNTLDLEGFIDLNRQELEGDNWSEENFWINLKSFGVNQDLLMTGAFAYEIDVHCSECRNFDVVAENPLRFPDGEFYKGLAEYVKEKGASATLNECTLYCLETPLRVYIAGEKSKDSQAMPTRLKLDPAGSSGICDAGKDAVTDLYVKRSNDILLQLVPTAQSYSFSAVVRA